MRAVPSRAEQSEGRSFPRDCIIPVETACVSSLGMRTVTIRDWWGWCSRRRLPRREYGLVRSLFAYGLCDRKIMSIDTVV